MEAPGGGKGREAHSAGLPQLLVFEPKATTGPGRPSHHAGAALFPANPSPDLTPLQTTDAFGNTIKIKAPKKDLSRKEKKAAAKAKAARKARGEEVSDDEEDF